MTCETVFSYINNILSTQGKNAIEENVGIQDENFIANINFGRKNQLSVERAEGGVVVLPLEMNTSIDDREGLAKQLICEEIKSLYIEPENFYRDTGLLLSDALSDKGRQEFLRLGIDINTPGAGVSEDAAEERPSWQERREAASSSREQAQR